MKLRIDPAYLAGLIGVSKYSQRKYVEHCVICGKATHHGKFFCLEHITQMPYAAAVHAQVDKEGA